MKLNDNKLASQLWTVTWVLLLGVMLLAGYQFRHLLLPEGDIEEAAISPDCNLRTGPCRAEFLHGQMLEFSILPESIPLLKPLQLNLKLTGMAVDSAEVLFVGINMDMGYNHARMNEVSKNQFSGTAVLPVCTLKRMEWEARVYIKSEGKSRLAAFPFYTQREDSASGSK